MIHSVFFHEDLSNIVRFIVLLIFIQVLEEAVQRTTRTVYYVITQAPVSLPYA